MNDENSDNNPTDKDDSTDINNVPDESGTGNLCSSGTYHDINYCAVNLCTNKDSNVVKVNDYYNNFDANFDNDMNDENSNNIIQTRATVLI